jgi:outer membrane protein OmpA-like peptidoglycan-associated protein
MSGRRSVIILVPLALLITAALALLVTWRQGDEIQASRAGRSPQPTEDVRGSSSVATPSVTASDAPAPAPTTTSTPVAGEELQRRIDDELASHPITFRPDRATLTREGERAVGRIAELIGGADRSTRFEVGGHVAAGPGGHRAALELSRQRARVVIDRLVEEGIDADRLTARAYGDTVPAPRGHDDRRVDITVR